MAIIVYTSVRLSLYGYLSSNTMGITQQTHRPRSLADLPQVFSPFNLVSLLRHWLITTCQRLALSDYSLLASGKNKEARVTFQVV